jgi:hypothetical protein
MANYRKRGLACQTKFGGTMGDADPRIAEGIFRRATKMIIAQ